MSRIAPKEHPRESPNDGLGHKDPQSNIYPTAAGGLLLVPTEAMWLVHEKSKPAAVLERAGLYWQLWYRWKDKYGQSDPWLFDWLYDRAAGRTLPPAAGRVGRHRRQSVKPPEDRGFEPDEQMLAFRRQATTVAVGRASVRTAQEAVSRPVGSTVSQGFIHSWLRRYHAYPWFERWLLCGENPPPHVTIARVPMIKACRASWDFARICSRSGNNLANYERWILHGLIPDLGWFLWLFGGPAPEGAFVVHPKLRKFRSENSQRRVCEKAGLDESTALKWNRQSPHREIFDAIKAAPAELYKLKRTEAFKGLDPRTQEAMEKYATTAKLSAVCERASIFPAEYQQLRRQAIDLGVIDALQQYLTCSGNYGIHQNKAAGLTEANFFIPSPLMLDFRKAAAEEMTRQGTWAYKDLPGFSEWFQDWALPRARLGKRISLRREAAGQEVPRAPESQADDRKVAGQPPVASDEREDDADTDNAAGQPQQEGSQRKRPAAQKHLRWKQWKDAGLSYNQIVQRHKDETGEEVSRDAVIQALRRLK
jgi:hypothetical protein